MSRLLIVGAGPMGLAAAHFASRAGLQVTVVEADDRPGGMAAHFDFGGLSIERFYHFCCRGDTDTFELLDEFGLADAMKWVPTKMGYFVDGRLFPFGDPLSLMRFTPLSLLDRVRYGIMVLLASRRREWASLDGRSARDWLVACFGERVYAKLWRPLLHLKFYEFTDSVSAAWVWQRISRLGRSRKSVFTEELGYIEGGTQTLVDELVRRLSASGVTFVYDAKVCHLVGKNGQVKGLETDDGRSYAADQIFSTAPLPHMAQMLKRDLPELAANYAGFDNVGVACVMHKLRRRVSDKFWTNISDPDIDIPGIVEFSNLRPLPEPVVYVPYYMPATHEKFAWTDRALIDESFGYLKRLNPDLADTDLIESHVGRLKHAQPVCHVGFSASIPDPRTAVEGLWIADTSFYYPEDRGISESIRYAKRVVREITGPNA